MPGVSTSLDTNGGWDKGSGVNAVLHGKAVAWLFSVYFLAKLVPARLFTRPRAGPLFCAWTVVQAVQAF